MQAHIHNPPQKPRGPSHPQGPHRRSVVAYLYLLRAEPHKAKQRNWRAVKHTQDGLPGQGTHGDFDRSMPAVVEFAHPQAH